MRVDDLTVEVRDRALERQGQIVPGYLNLTGKSRWCAVGEWEVTLPGDHSMVPHLVEPGSGLVVTGPTGAIHHPTEYVDYEGTQQISRAAWTETVYGTLFSGPTTTPLRVRNRKNPDGTYTFKGVTDEVILLGTRAFPDPSIADPQESSRSRANDTRTGSAETLMRQYVGFNVAADLAPAGRIRGLRKFLDLQDVSLNRGIQVTKSPRFQNLLELLQEIVLLDPSLGFRVVQVDDILEFQVLDAGDRRDLVRFDIENGTITSEEIAISGPSVTDAIVAGQGEGAERTIISRTTPEAQAAEEEWGIVYETFVDQRDTDDLVELEQSGDEALADGRGGSSVKMVPADDTTMRYGLDWVLGNLVTMVVAGTETVARVTETALIASPSGVMIGAGIGDLSGFTKQDAEGSKIESIDQRVARLERSGGVAERLAPGGREIDNWDLAVDVGFYWSADGAANAPAAGMCMGRVVRDQSRIVQEVPDPSSIITVTWRRVYSGSWGEWVPIGQGIPFRQAAGSLAAAQNTIGSGVIVFPTPFDVPPIMQITLRSYKANTQIFISSVSATEFSWGTYIISAGSNTNGVAFDWIATQMTQDAAAG